VGRDIPGGDRVRNALKTENVNQPIEQSRRIVVAHRSENALLPEVIAYVIQV
jgi:hypothetical protein